MDEVFKSTLKYQPHEDKLYRLLTQPSEDLILRRAAELRKNPDAMRDLSFGRLAATIPFNVFEKALRDGFQLNSPDKDIRQKDMFRFLNTPEGKACLVTEKY